MDGNSSFGEVVGELVSLKARLLQQHEQELEVLRLANRRLQEEIARIREEHGREKGEHKEYARCDPDDGRERCTDVNTYGHQDSDGEVGCHSGSAPTPPAIRWVRTTEEVSTWEADMRTSSGESLSCPASPPAAGSSEEWTSSASLLSAMPGATKTILVPPTRKRWVRTGGASLQLPGCTGEGDPSQGEGDAGPLPTMLGSGGATGSKETAKAQSGHGFTLREAWFGQHGRCPSQAAAGYVRVLPAEPARSRSIRIIGERWRESKCVVHPASRVQVARDVLSLVVAACDVVEVPLHAFDLPSTTSLTAVAWVSRIFWTVDVQASFVTGAYVNGTLQMKLSAIARHYSKTWLPLDLVVVSSQWLELVLSEGTAIAVLRGVRMLRLLRLLRLVNVQAVLHMLDSRLTPSGAGSVRLALLMAIYAHMAACAWYGIGRARADGWVRQNYVDSASAAHSYMASLRWALAQVHGSSSIQPTNVLELVFANAVMCLGLTLLIAIVSSTTSAMTLIAQQRGKENQQLTILCSYLKQFRISPVLSVRVKQYLDSCCKRTQDNLRTSNETKAVLALLPQSLQMDLAMELCGPVISNYQFFNEIDGKNPRVVRELCHEALSEVTVQAFEIVCSAGDACTRMLFVRTGNFQYSCQRRRGTANQSPERLLSAKHRQTVAPCSVMRGQFISEAVLWTTWEYCGQLASVSHGAMIALEATLFAQVITQHAVVWAYAASYARHFIRWLNQCDECSDILSFDCDCIGQGEDWLEPQESMISSEMSMDAERRLTSRSWTASSSSSHDKRWRRTGTRSLSGNLCSSTKHFIFISHHKADAGTEAALMQEALERMIEEDDSNPGHSLCAPVFLDSEDLADLSDLKEHVRNSCNVVLLLTKDVLTRPWVLVEIVTALQSGANIVPVEVQKRDVTFAYPDEAFYQRVVEGLGDERVAQQLSAEGIALTELETALRHVFRKIAAPFSPHKSANVREAELMDILKRCQDSPDLH